VLLVFLYQLLAFHQNLFLLLVLVDHGANQLLLGADEFLPLHLGQVSFGDALETVGRHDVQLLVQVTAGALGGEGVAAELHVRVGSVDRGVDGLGTEFAGLALGFDLGLRLLRTAGVWVEVHLF